MKKYKNGFISHFTAAHHYKIPYLDDVLGEIYTKKRRVDDPVHVTVVNLAQRYKKKGRITHLCILPLPNGAVRKDAEKYIASPELVFLQLANYLDMNRLILLGFQMCAHPLGKSTGAITTKRKLRAFLEKISGHRGYRKAKRALKYVENGSNSIMESIAYMILTLPYSYGGYALSGASLNHEIKSEKNAKHQSRQKKYYVDFFYKRKKIAVEYDSMAYHSSPAEQGKNSIRATSLELQGIKVISFATIQLYNERACDEFAQNLALHLGRGIRKYAKGFEDTKRNLRKMLPTRQR